MFNRVGIGFNRISKWNRIIFSVRTAATFIPVYIRTRLEVVVDLIRGW